MADVIVRLRPDGVRQIVRSSAPLESCDRHALLLTTLFVAGGYFLAGAMPPGVFGAIVACCAFGEILGAAPALALRLRPAASVIELPVRGPRRRSG
jgi:hypothetical protein